MKRLLQLAVPVGLAVLVIGAGWGVLAPRVTPGVYQALLLLGAVSVAAGLWSERSRIFNPAGGKRARYGASFLASAVIGLLIVLLINFLAVRYRERWDLTRTQTFSLHPATVRVLEQIDRDVDVYGFFPERSMEFTQVRSQYEKFAFEQPRIRVTVADPNKRPDLVSELGVTGNEMTVVKAGERMSFFPGYDEATLAAALLEVTREQAKVVYWMIGHGERTLDQSGGEGYRRFEGDLVKSFFKVRAFSLGPGETVPDDASLVVVADPREAFRDEEIEALDAYLRGGGRLLVMADIRLDQPGSHPLERLLEQWGVRPQQAVLVDPREEKMQAYPNLLMATPDRFGGHETVSGLQGKRLVTQTARPIEFFQLIEDQQIFHHVLVRGGRGTYAETELEEFRDNPEIDERERARARQNPPPPAVSVLAYRDFGRQEGSVLASEARLAIVGDADFAKDEYYDSGANGEFMLNLVRWMTGDEVLIRREGEETYAKLAMTIEPDQRRLVRLVFLIEAAFVFMLGWVVWIVRRSK
jgi:hypothetical protein